LWTIDIRLPEISSYPIIDFASKTKDPSDLQGTKSPVSDVFEAGVAARADGGDVRRAVAGRRVKFRDDIDPARPLIPWLRRPMGLHRQNSK
jgi:hypothetical protein